MDVLDIVYADACIEHGTDATDRWLADYGKPYEETEQARRDQEAMDRRFGGVPDVAGVEVIE